MLNGDINADEYTVNQLLNVEFNEKEISNIIKKLKNNKANGVDLVINEFIKCTFDKMCPIYVKLFNLILKVDIFLRIG